MSRRLESDFAPQRFATSDSLTALPRHFEEPWAGPLVIGDAVTGAVLAVILEKDGDPLGAVPCERRRGQARWAMLAIAAAAALLALIVTVPTQSPSSSPRAIAELPR